MDAGDDESVNRAVRTVLDAEGRIDALVNNAGVSLVGAVEALAEALAYEVRPYGLDVVIVEPGNIATTIAQSRRVTDAARAKSAYPQTTSLLETIASEEHAGSDPQVVARLVAKVLAARRPRLRFSAGPVSERLAPWVKRLLPNRVIHALVRSHYAG